MTPTSPLLDGAEPWAAFERGLARTRLAMAAEVEVVVDDQGDDEPAGSFDLVEELVASAVAAERARAAAAVAAERRAPPASPRSCR